MHVKLDEIEKCIGYSFQDKKLLVLALTHPSYNEHDRTRPDNQRMEFLGDSILSAILTEALFIAFPKEDEGSLSRKRAVFIRGSSLAKIAYQLRIHKYLLMSTSELKNNGNQRSSTLEDAIEAIIGAIFIDGGIKDAKKCVLNWFGDLPKKLVKDQPSYNPKGQLQEFLHEKSIASKVQYRISKEAGPAHQKNFEIDLIVGKKTLGSGTGSTKKEAEEEAAKQALSKLKFKQ
ncbi:MAG: ribonuclease III [Opitutae bacterium]|nr:ribonuclease III [Opitutae bacterium]